MFFITEEIGDYTAYASAAVVPSDNNSKFDSNSEERIFYTCPPDVSDLRQDWDSLMEEIILQYVETASSGFFYELGQLGFSQRKFFSKPRRPVLSAPYSHLHMDHCYNKVMPSMEGLWTRPFCLPDSEKNHSVSNVQENKENVPDSLEFFSGESIRNHIVHNNSLYVTSLHLML